jgi:hypothetical protein
MKRGFAFASLTLGLAVGFGAPIANASLHGGFPNGAHLYGFGPRVVHKALANTPASPKLASPLDFLNVTGNIRNQPLAFPFLNAPQSRSRRAAGAVRANADEAQPGSILRRVDSSNTDAVRPMTAGPELREDHP